MAYAYPTLLDCRKRTAYLRGETDYTTANAVIDDHINFTVQDIVLLYPFDFDKTSTSLTLLAGTATLPADYIAKWGIEDLRITGNDDAVFTLINVGDRGKYTADDYVYWITFSTTTKRYIVNSLTQTGSLTAYYHFFPSPMVDSTDYCLVPDTEAVSYLAASKNWVGDERNLQLKADYEKEGLARIETLWQAEMRFGAAMDQGSIIDMNVNLLG